MWQAEQVRSRLGALYPHTAISVLGVPAPGDPAAPRSQSAGGDRAVMIRDLEAAIADGRADLAVHSLKNLPPEIAPGFTIAGITAREDPRDAFVSRRYASLAQLPAGAVIGTSSLRREAQLRERFPALEVKPLRGDLDARLRVLDTGRCAALIIAASSLKRAGYASLITSLLEPDESLPAPGQGALGIECLAARTDLVAWLAPLDDRDTALAVRAERALSRTLSGSCQLPLGGYAEIERGSLRLRGFVATQDGAQVIRGELSGAPEEAETLGERLARQLLEQGADRILAAIVPP